jgi:hypothetical protein
MRITGFSWHFKILELVVLLIMKYLKKQNCQLLFFKTYPTLLFIAYEHKGMNGNARGCSYLLRKSSRAAHSHLLKTLT